MNRERGNNKITNKEIRKWTNFELETLNFEL
jgi:hypothetical protein